VGLYARTVGLPHGACSVPKGTSRHTAAGPVRFTTPCHATVAHGVREWALDDDGNGQREVHCHSCEGAGAALQTYLRAFRGVHKQYLHLYVETYEAMINAKRVTPALIQRLYLGELSAHTGHT
jgi:transposase